MYILFLIFCVTLRTSVRAIAIDNDILGEPEIECSSDHVLVNFNTRAPFEGHTFVKGHYSTPDCRIDATGNRSQRSTSLNVAFDNCGVRRQRSLNPAGLFVTATVVLSFHPQFVTKIDKAYHVKCFYMEADKTVTSVLGVSMLTTTLFTQNVPMPVCTYEVRQTDRDGALVRFARIGDRVYHRWTCDSETVEIFCMTIHSCYVADSQETKVQLLDENGCATDKYLLDNVEYNGDLDGGQESMVFKFADKPSLFFNCQIRLSLKEEGKCRRSSDSCVAPLRGKRSARKPLIGPNVDVYSEDITVYDDVDSLTADSALSTRRGHESPFSGVRAYPGHYSTFQNQGNNVCLNRITIGMILTVFSFFFMCAIVLTTITCLRSLQSTNKVF